MKTRKGNKAGLIEVGRMGSVSWGTGEHPGVGVFVPFSKYTLRTPSVSDPVLAGWPWVGLW